MVYKVSISLTDRIEEAEVVYDGVSYTLNESNNYRVEISATEGISLNNDDNPRISFIGNIAFYIMEGEKSVYVNPSEYIPFTIDDTTYDEGGFVLQPSSLYAWQLDSTTFIYTPHRIVEYDDKLYDSSGISSTTFGEYDNCYSGAMEGDDLIIYSDGDTYLCPRDTSHDLVWDSSSSSYVQAPPTYRVEYIHKDTFKNNQNITSVDLNNVPFPYGDASTSFYECQNITSVTNIHPSTSNIYRMFYNCLALNNTPDISGLNNVTNAFSAFITCKLLQNAPTLPNSITNIEYMFAWCPNLVNAPDIPNTVTSLYGTFMGCKRLANLPEIPNSVINLCDAFQQCEAITDSPIIPNSVTDMSSTFMGCMNLVNAPTIPNSVTRMSLTFMGCEKLQTAPEIPDSVSEIYGMFSQCSKLRTAPNISHLTNCTEISSMFEYCVLLTDAPELPTSATEMYSTFAGCRSLVNVPTIPDSMSNLDSAFIGCIKLTDMPALGNNATNLHYTFGECSRLVNMKAIPDSVTNLSHTFYDCSNLVTSNTIGSGVTNMESTFRYCPKLTGDIYIKSNQISSAASCFMGTTNTKNVYIPFYYENGEYTQTYSSFITAGYKTDGSVNGVYLKDINLL